VEPEAGTSARYKAFISYSHRDARFAVSLHRQLEAYRLPARLVGTQTARGLVPARLTPIFRDIDELPASDDLSAEILGALAASEALIVLCSPDARASRWVNREVELFRQLHPERPVLPVLLRGDPDDAFPAALYAPGPDGEVREPVASDFRGEGARLGRTKLIAGLTGVGVDDLVQREAQRRLRRVMAVTAAAVIAVIILSTLLALALRARAEAQRQQAEAEGLIEFMLTDLRGRLRGVGRLDVMSAVNARAMNYYEDQGLSALPDESLERRARLLHAMGEDDDARGDTHGALAKFREAHRSTAASLARRPSDAETLFAHAQSEYWLGYLDYRAHRFEAARTRFSAYASLADMMVAAKPGTIKYVREQGYAQSNLCALALTPKKKDAPLAARACRAAVVAKERVALADRADSSALADLANSYGWLADAQTNSGDAAGARDTRKRQAEAINRAVATDPQNLDYRDIWVTLQFALAVIDRDDGKPEAGRKRLRDARAAVEDMVKRDPANEHWKERLTQVDRRIRKFEDEVQTHNKQMEAL
jgi:hypothetical protein